MAKLSIFLSIEKMGIIISDQKTFPLKPTKSSKANFADAPTTSPKTSSATSRRFCIFPPTSATLNLPIPLRKPPASRSHPTPNSRLSTAKAFSLGFTSTHLAPHCG